MKILTIKEAVELMASRQAGDSIPYRLLGFIEGRASLETSGAEAHFTGVDFAYFVSDHQEEIEKLPLKGS